MDSRKSSAFTLIELLIVVAIIAILAAIAVPNFLEAQVRAKVSREKNNMRAIATALESYKVDTNKYPMDAWWWAFQPVVNDLPLSLLTTPVAYMTSIPEAVFYNKRKDQAAHPAESFVQRQYPYGSEMSTIPAFLAGGVGSGLDLLWGGYDIPPDVTHKYLWFIYSIGPDKLLSNGTYLVYGEDIVNKMKELYLNDTLVVTHGAIYDPTNGTISVGDIVRVGP